MFVLIQELTDENCSKWVATSKHDSRGPCKGKVNADFIAVTK